MIQRQNYLNQLIGLKDKHIAKVVTGVRRCGKSTLLDLYQDYLRSTGIKQEQIISVKLEDRKYADLKTWEQLYDYIESQMVPGMQNYIFIDEVQNIPDSQRAADALFIKDNVDLYLTGSNSKFSSGEWATIMRGRFMEIKMTPLSFKEYLSGVNTTDKTTAFRNFVLNGGFPQTLMFDTQAQIQSYIESIYDTIVVRDVLEVSKTTARARLESIITFLADNIGKEVSLNNIATALKLGVHTVERYVNALCKAYVFYKVPRYDVRGKKILKSLNKYYIVDTGLRNLLLHGREIDQGRLLENIVFLELYRRTQGKVFTGKLAIFDKQKQENGQAKTVYSPLEIDFVTNTDLGTKYYQVSLSVLDEKTKQRELEPLQSVSDHNAKILLTLDTLAANDYNGIKHENVIDWLLNDSNTISDLCRF